MAAVDDESRDRHAFEAFKQFLSALREAIETPSSVTQVMTADEAAAFLGVDRNTIYEFAGRGAIPHQRLGKRLLFHRAALVSWLDANACKATSTRKG